MTSPTGTGNARPFLPRTLLFLVFAVFLAPVLMGGGVLTAGESTILIVLTSDAAPFHRAAETLASALSAQAWRSRILLRDQTTVDDLKGIRIAVGVGTGATTWLDAQLAPGVSLYYCMVAQRIEGITGHPDPTGVTTEVPLAEQCRLIAEALPSGRRLGVLYRSDNPSGRALISALTAALPPGWSITAVDIDHSTSIAVAIDDLIGRGVDVVWTYPDAGIFTGASVRTLLLAGLRQRVPVFGFSTIFVKAGAMIGIGIDPAMQGTQVASLILAGLHTTLPQGARPGSASVDPRYQIALNLIVADKLGISLPAGLVSKAGVVFQDHR